MENDINHYFTLEEKLKSLLNNTVISQFKIIYHKLSRFELNHFSITPDNVNLNWTINVNYTYTNWGDLSTSTLQKFYHTIFKKLEENEENNNFKNTFIEILNNNIVIALNENQSEHIEKYKIENNFININLKEKGKVLISTQVKVSKKDTKPLDMFQVYIL
jgi:hypothetical protein